MSLILFLSSTNRVKLTDGETEAVGEDPGVLVDVLVIHIMALVSLNTVVLLLHLRYEII